MEHQAGPDEPGAVNEPRSGPVPSTGEPRSEPGPSAGEFRSEPTPSAGEFRSELVPSMAEPRSEPVPSTGEPRVDAALMLLERLAELPVSEHPEVFEQVHAQLSDVLGELDSGPAGPVGA